MTLNKCLALAFVLLLLFATTVQAQIYLPLVLSNGDTQAAEISYGFHQVLEQNRWIDIECVTGEPVATMDNGRLHVVCELP